MVITEKDMITFYEKARGSSHIASNKPCQDNGLHYCKDGVCIVVVCDGHGGDSYVRSEKGSLIAADVTKERILEFINSPKASLLINNKGAVPAVPLFNPLVGKNGERLEYNSLSESQQEYARQSRKYVEETRKNADIESAFRELFADIVRDWRSRIEEDKCRNSFNKYEKEKLGAKRIEKAYGTTLMAAVRTKDYWFAFHLGDGKLLTCNNFMKWEEPVPWDCNCFLNTTTSLCDNNPIEEFRYAFDGTGNFPLAFVLGSDGIDDTFIKQELLHKFYSQLLCVFEQYPIDEALSHLRIHLPILSEKGSHDDMSIGVIIDTKHLKTATQYYAIIAEKDALDKERDEKDLAINSQKAQINEVKIEIERLKSEYKVFCSFIWTSFKEMVKKRQKDKEEEREKHRILEEKKLEIRQMNEQLKSMESEYEKWKENGRKRIAQLKEYAETLKEQILFNSINVNKFPLSSKSQSSETEEDLMTSEPIMNITSSPLSKEENEQLERDSEKQVKEIMNKEEKSWEKQ